MIKQEDRDAYFDEFCEQLGKAASNLAAAGQYDTAKQLFDVFEVAVNKHHPEADKEAVDIGRRMLAEGKRMLDLFAQLDRAAAGAN